MIFEVVAFFVSHVRTTAEVESKRTDPKVDLTTENAGHGLVSTPAIWSDNRQAESSRHKNIKQLLDAA